MMMMVQPLPLVSPWLLMMMIHLRRTALREEVTLEMMLELLVIDEPAIDSSPGHIHLNGHLGQMTSSPGFRCNF